jgi:hypothetical protein
MPNESKDTLLKIQYDSSGTVFGDERGYRVSGSAGAISKPLIQRYLH